MKQSHFLVSLPLIHQKRVFVASLVASIVLVIVFNWTGRWLTTPAAQLGIVSYEFAGTPQRSQEILASWDQTARISAAFGLGLDYIFMLTYATSIALGCIWAGRTLSEIGWPFARLATWLVWGVYLAAGFDALENVALMIQLMQAQGSSPWVEVSLMSATIKFGLLFIALVYVFYSLVVRLLYRVKH